MSTSNFPGIELPIIQAPMAGSQASALAIAVSESGALGSLPAALMSLEVLRKELSILREKTSRPFNVNFFCHVEPIADAAREQAWRGAFAPYYREYEIDPATIAPGPGRMPFNAEALAVIAEFKPAIVSFHFGLPSPELVAGVKALGAKVLSSATTVAEARWLESRGVDAIIAQGVEAGGHRGMFLSEDVTTQVGTFSLLPQVVRAVRVPVIATGGIADAKGVKAALSLGAAAAQIGTAYLLCPESSTSAVHRAALASEQSVHTALTNLFTGRPARGVMNRVMRELGPMSSAPPQFPLAATAITPLRTRAEAKGSGDFSPLWSGQNPSGCKAIAAGRLTRELAGV